MKRDPLKASVLATKIIPNVSPDLAKELNLGPDMKSLALITADSDDVTYTALDEATKKSGLEAAVDVIENQAHFVSANEDDSICYYAHCISRTGSYLSEGAGIKEGEALAYLIAPPLEAMYGVDAALKAADVKMCVLYAPPSETNFGGALLTGSQSACKSACDAFAAAVEFVADNPIA